DGKFRSGNRNRTATATGIWLAELVANKFDAGYLAIFNDDPRLLDIEHQFCAFSLGVFNLFRSRCHLFDRPSVACMNLGPQAQRGARPVKPAKPTSHHHPPTPSLHTSPFPPPLS